MLTFKRKLILNKAQAQRIESWIGVCRLIHNLCIEIRKEGYKNHGITVHRFALNSQLKTIKDIPWIADVPAMSLINAVKRMDLAYQGFFRTFKSGGGFPKFANKRRYKSISFYYNVSIKENSIKIPKIGYLKMFKDSPISGEIKVVTIKSEPKGYYAYIVTDAAKSINNQDESQILGIDMGVARLYTDSNGNYSPNPKHFKIHEKKLRIQDRSLTRKRKGGKNWVKQANRLSRLHAKISNIRRDFLHKESTRIAKLYNTVVLEDLNIKGIVKNRNLSKHVLDSGWGIFRQMLEYKTNVIAVDPKFTSQICNDCGAKDKKSRISQSEFVCTSCGAKSHADENAAKNILGQGMAIIRKRGALVRA